MVYKSCSVSSCAMSWLRGRERATVYNSGEGGEGAIDELWISIDVVVLYFTGVSGCCLCLVRILFLPGIVRSGCHSPACGPLEPRVLSTMAFLAVFC